MTGTLAKLRIALQLDSAAFESGAKRAAGQLDDFGSKAERTGFRIGSLSKAVLVAGTAIAGSAIASQIKDMAMRGLEYASALGETAQQLGVSARELQEYRYAASQTGIEASEMDTALARLTKTAGEAAQGGKAQGEAFARLGINIRDANGNVRSAGELIPEIAEKMKGLGSDAERAATLTDLLGRSGQKMAPLLAEGAAGVNKLRDAAHRMGIVLTEKQLQDADKTAGKLDDLKQILEARIASTVADNAQVILDLAEALTTFVNKIGDALRAWKSFNDTMSRRSTADLQIARASAALDGRADLSSAQRTSAKAQARQIIERRNGIRTESVGGFWGALGVRRSSSTTANLGVGSNPFGEYGIGGGDGLRRLIEIAGPREEMIERMVEYREEMARLKEQTAQATAKMKTDWLDASQSIIGSLQNLESSIRGGGPLSILSAVIGIGMQLGSLGVFGKKVKANINVPKYADGTRFHPGGLAMVGERGPELVNLPRGAQVYPNGTGPGGGATYHFQGNLMTPEFWQMIQQGDASAARAGSSAAQRQMAFRQSRQAWRV